MATKWKHSRAPWSPTTRTLVLARGQLSGVCALQWQSTFLILCREKTWQFHFMLLIICICHNVSEWCPIGLTRYVLMLLTMQGSLASRPAWTVRLGTWPTNSGSSFWRCRLCDSGCSGSGCLDQSGYGEPAWWETEIVRWHSLHGLDSFTSQTHLAGLWWLT